MTGTRPTLSASQPMTGENANIPATCTLMTKPMTEMDAPPCVMCTGVMTMTVTITVCPTTTATRPSTAARTGGMAAHPARSTASAQGGDRTPHRAGAPSAADRDAANRR